MERLAANERAQRAPFAAAGRPGIDVSGDGRGCNTIAGRFEVKEYALTADGSVERLWVVYEQHCEGAIPALFGEVRIGMPAASPVAEGLPHAIRWPAEDPHAPATVVPVTVVAAQPVTFSAASLSGPSAADFQVRLDECKDVTLAAGEACQVWVRFLPRDPGIRTAALELRGSNGFSQTVPLEAFVFAGRTQLLMESDSGDWVGAGQTYRYSPADATVGAWGNQRYVRFSIDAANGDWWYGDFAAPEGDILVPGETFTARRYPFNGPGAGIDVSGNGRGCNRILGTFTVTAAGFTPEGELEHFGVRFEQHCEEGAPALRGEFEFRVPPAPPEEPALPEEPAPTEEPAPPAGSPGQTAGQSAQAASAAPSVPQPAVTPGGGAAVLVEPLAAPLAEATFAVLQARVARSGRWLVHTVRTPDAGRLSTRVTGRLGGRRVLLGTAVRSVGRDGVHRQRVRLSAMARRALAARSPVRAQIRTTFRPAAGPAITTTRRILIEPVAKRR
jgi:hypothetical protein